MTVFIGGKAVSGEVKPDIQEWLNRLATEGRKRGLSL